jgi:integrase
MALRESSNRQTIPSGHDSTKAHQATARAAGLGDVIGWLDTATDPGWTTREPRSLYKAPLTVQKELMRHASIQTTMNVYGKAMSNTKREAHSRVVKAVLPGRKSGQIATSAA